MKPEKRKGEEVLKRWVSKRCDADFKKIASHYGISEILAEVLVKRGLYTWESMDAYLFPDLRAMHNPELMKDLAKAGGLLEDLISKGEKICVIGDYDVDGIMSSYILKKGIEMLGGTAFCIIPHRVRDGYGIRAYMVDESYGRGAAAIITCDNGISAPEAAIRAKELGMTYILTDHHEIPVKDAAMAVPPADAVINPKQPDCGYPFKELCGAGVAYKLMSYVFEGRGDKRYVGELLPYAAVAAVCDVVPLMGENRIIVSNGLKMFSEAGAIKNAGMRALLEGLGLYGKIHSSDLAFKVGPCINAAGRLGDAAASLEMLFEKDEKAAFDMAEGIIELNEERKKMTADAEAMAIKKIEEENMLSEKVLVICLKNCHESVAGIVAGRIKERYYRPTYILTKGKKGLKGSGRSIPGYHMQGELVKCQDLLTEFGGHSMAAGFTLPQKNLEEFIKALNAQCTLTKEDLVEKVVFDMEVKLSDIDTELIGQLKFLEPYGEANGRAVFARRGVKIKSVRMCGSRNQVARLKLEDDGAVYDAVDFNAKECVGAAVEKRYGHGAWDEVKNGVRGRAVDILYEPDLNERYGNIQFKIVDCR